MFSTRSRSDRSRVLAAAAAIGVAVVGLAVAPRVATQATPLTCPAGTEPANDVRPLVAPDQAAQLPPQYRGFQELEPSDALADVTCLRVDRPESFQEMALRDREWSAARTAPFAEVVPGANLAAAEQRLALVDAADEVEGADGTFAPYGEGPLIFDDERWNEGQIAELGLVDSTGRIDDLTYVPGANQLYAAIGTGGIWRSDDLGDSWVSISDSLPAAVVGAVTYSPAGGPQGTILTITGEHTFGGNAYTGIGAWYSRDGGTTWLKSAGIPDGALGFTIEVDPTDPNVVYAGTQDGLFRSGDAGLTYTNVMLPTGDCAGVERDVVRCNFANMVTDVVIKEPGGVGADKEGGTVVAIVGWRAGMMTNPDGSVQSPNNGVYRSATGEVGSFTRAPGLDSAVGGKQRIGRVELGPTIGAAQNHDYLYAVVEDAVLFNGGFPIGDIPADEPTVRDPVLGLPIGANATVLNGIFVSADFGVTWTQLESQEQLAASCPTNGSALCLPGIANPGQQAWYDMWIAPDPSVQAVGGIPSRVVFGLEEIWQNVRGVAAEDAGGEAPVNSEATTFEVFGRYFSGSTCALGLVPTPAGVCATSRPPSGSTTPHPDQHDGIFVPTETGTALLVGHDGGFSRQDVGAREEFNNGDWLLDQNNGLRTLLPYSAVIANDGVAWAGLQDNGHMKIVPGEGFAQYETFGGDGTFAAVDYENSDYAFESVQGGVMNVTSDGGLTWDNAEAPATGKRFVNPFVMDETNSNHVATGGREIFETLIGPMTRGEPIEGGALGEAVGWTEVFDLGITGAQDQEPTGDANITTNNGMSAIDTRGDVTYVGFCGACDILNARIPFRSGIATNLATGAEPAAGTPSGWGFVPAEGLPNRFVTNVTIDPADTTGRTVYVALGGYSRRWVPPGTAGERNADVGEGHVFKSTDAGQTFTDISGDLPDIPAAWIEPRGDQLIVGTDNGVYISSDTDGGPYAVLGGDRLPAVPIASLQMKADDPNFLLVGTYGRGLYAYTFPPPAPRTPAEVRRVAGPDRVQTAIETAQERFADGSAPSVVLARGDDYADALAGAPFARSVDAPLLLTPSDRLGDGVLAEIQRLGADETVYVLGGPQAISPAVVTELEAAGFTVERVGGTNRFDTARVLAERLGGTSVYVTEGFDPDPSRGWPDALAVAPLAAAQGRPILLVDTNGLPDETAAAIDALDVQDAVVVGGTTAVSQAVEDEVAALGVTTGRVAGETRFATSALVAALAERAGLTYAQTWLARGSNWPDALASGPTVAASGGILLLVGDGSLDESPPTRDLLVSHACEIELLRVLGGVQALSAAVEQQARDLLTGLTCAVEPEVPPVGVPDPEPTVPTGEVLAGPFTFDAGAEGWTVDTDSRGLAAWARNGDGPDGSTAFAVEPYDDMADTSLISPELATPGGPLFVTYAVRSATEDGFDEVGLEWSSDAMTWTRVDTVGGFNEGFPEFEERLAVIKDAPAGRLFLRFRFLSDALCSVGSEVVCTSDPAATGSFEGVRIDDVSLQR